MIIKEVFASDDIDIFHMAFHVGCASNCLQ
jgi:hypothetical protein